MQNLLDVIEGFLGPAPNDFILNLYYVLAIILIIYITKLFIMLLRSMLGLHSNRL